MTNSDIVFRRDGIGDRAILFGDCTGNWDSSHSAALGRSVAAARAPHVRLGRPTTDGAVVSLRVGPESGAESGSVAGGGGAIRGAISSV